MKLDLTRFRCPVDHVERTLAPAEVSPADADAYRVVAPVALAFDVHKDENRFRLDGTVRTELELACSRCLEPFHVPVDVQFDLRYLPQSEEPVGGDRYRADEDIDASYYLDDAISLSDLLQEQFYLAIPMKPLCRKGCRGLCSQCGTNLNDGACTCAAAWEDPRLAPLRGFGKTRDA